MATIFTKIIKGEIPCYKIAEDENYFAFWISTLLLKGTLWWCLSRRLITFSI